LVVLIYFYIRYNNSFSRNEANSSSTQPTDTELLSDLPATYYVLAILCGVVLLVFTLVNAKDLSGAEIGSLIGYTVGGVLSMFAVGRGRKTTSPPPPPRSSATLGMVSETLLISTHLHLTFLPKAALFSI
jgi:hypothetical protein